MLLDDAKIDSTSLVFGSARNPVTDPIDKSGNRRTPYEEARALARLASGPPVGDDGHLHFVI